MPSDDESIACENNCFRKVAPSKGWRKWSRKAERQLTAITPGEKKVDTQQCLGQSQAKLQADILAAYSEASSEVRAEDASECTSLLHSIRQQLGEIAEEHAKRSEPQTQAYRELLDDVSTAVSSAIGKLAASRVDDLHSLLPDLLWLEYKATTRQARCQSQKASAVLEMLPPAVAVIWHCVLEERMSAATASVDKLRPSQRLPPEKRAPLICNVQVTILAGHIAVAAEALSGSQVCSGAAELQVDIPHHALMHVMMHKLYEVSQTFNKSGRGKLLVPVDVALENHFTDDKVMKVHLPLMRRGYTAEDAWRAFFEAQEAGACDSATVVPSAATEDKDNKSKASGSTRTGQTMRRGRSESLPDPGAALVAKSLRAKAHGLRRPASSKRSKHVIRTHYHLVPRLAMPAQVTQKCMPNFPVAKRPKQLARTQGCCLVSVIPDTEKVSRACCMDAPSASIKKRLDFVGFEDCQDDHGGLHGVTAEDFAMFPAMDIPAAVERKTIFKMH